MSPFLVGALSLTIVFGAAIGGMFLRSRLPDHHLAPDSKDAIKLATAIIGTLSAIALGLMVASAKRSFDDASADMRTTSARLVLLDRVLAQYGPETEDIRRTLRKLVEARLHAISRDVDGALNEGFDVEAVQASLRDLSPQTDARRWLQTRALQLGGQIAEMRWLRPESEAAGFPMAFVVILVFWLSILFASFGILAPGNPTVVVTLLASALSVTGALVLIIDMDHPYLGFIRISDVPLRLAFERLGHP